MTRRALMASMLTIGIAGCAPEPWIGDIGSSATPSMLADHFKAVAQANAMVLSTLDGLIGLAAGDETLGDWARQMLACHRGHHQVLCQSDPLGGVQARHQPVEEITATAPVAASVEAAKQDYAAALQGLTQAASAALDQTTDYSERLLFASLLLSNWASESAITSKADALGAAPVPGDAVPSPLTSEVQDDPWQVLLGRLRALVYGLEELTGAAIAAGMNPAPLEARLSQAQLHRDFFLMQLRQRAIEPEPALVAYPLNGDLTDTSAHAGIWGDLELAVLHAHIPVLAADAGFRAVAAKELAPNLAQLRTLLVPLPYWPGWV